MTLSSVDRPAVIGCLEDYMNGNNTDKVVGTENVFLVSRARLKVLVSWNRSGSLLSANTQISCNLEHTSTLQL